MNKDPNIVADEVQEPVGLGSKIMGMARSVTSSPTMHRQINATKQAGVIITKLAAGRLVLNNITEVAAKGLPFGMGMYIKANPLNEALFKFSMAQALAIMGGAFISNLSDDDPRAGYFLTAIDAATLASVDALREASGIEDFIMEKILTKDVLDKIKPLVNKNPM